MSTDARHAALVVLNRLDTENRTLDALMDDIHADRSLHDRRDRALLQTLVYGVTRWRARLDWIIDRFSKKPVHRLDPVVVNILRLGLYQILYLDKIPPSAAVNTSVQMAKSSTSPWTAGFVNAVLRNTIRRYNSLAFPNPETDPVTGLSINQSFPEWLIHRWLKRFGHGSTQQLCESVNSIPPLTIRTNTLRSTREDLIQSLESCTDHPTATAYAPDGITFCHPRTPVSDMPAFQKGWFQVQDEAAQIVSLMLNPRPGDTVLDACAGLGGKTGHIAQLMNNQGRVTAMDKDRNKLRRLETEMMRLGVLNVTTRCRDIYNMSGNDPKVKFDRILLDAPCSGLGVIRRNPDIKWRLSKQDLSKFQHRQIEFLDILSRGVKPTGVLVYSVCSSEPEENEQVINTFLNTHPKFVIEKNPAYLPSRVRSLIDERGMLKTFPHTHDMDGFYAVVLTRKT